MGKVAGKKLAVLGIVLAVAAGFGWWQRAPLLSWYYIHNLAHADEARRPEWARRVAGLDQSALPQLIRLLHGEDTAACANAGSALAALLERWGPTDARTAMLAKDLINQYPTLGTPGREAVLDWQLALLTKLDRNPDRAVYPELEQWRDLAVEGLTSTEAGICARAVRLVMQPPLNAEKGMLDRVVPMLRHSAPEVRRAAVLALGLAEEAVAVQDLLPLLQDADAEVRGLCEKALRGRGLQDSHIKLAKLITDPRSHQRLQVVDFLAQTDDLDPGIWLMHLSQDPSPAVRAAAIRFARDDPGTGDFQARLMQMARDDPSPTVRQIAAFYLGRK